ncbi:hypothetical protein KPL78_29880 [Roseomonas sp. HJA6]|uniref:Phasin domain-containing protein n=2 Tax=Roseomonas alba TaxID=2846776 RepID=A0ABS7ALT1_9PROT|nr:hypothetical protein [Neoroseomonas alba]
MTMSSTEHGPLADTMWPISTLVPWFGAAEAAEPANRHPAVSVALRRLQQEQQGAIEAQFAMVRSALEHASQAASRLATAHDPGDAIVAQVGFGLALTELAAAPVRAWLEVIPKLHECCMAMANDPPAPSFAARGPADPTASDAQPARTRPRKEAAPSPDPG